METLYRKENIMRETEEKDYLDFMSDALFDERKRAELIMYLNNPRLIPGKYQPSETDEEAISKWFKDADGAGGYNVSEDAVSKIRKHFGYVEYGIGPDKPIPKY